MGRPKGSKNQKKNLELSINDENLSPDRKEKTVRKKKSEVEKALNKIRRMMNVKKKQKEYSFIPPLEKQLTTSELVSIAKEKEPWRVESLKERMENK
jgi:hypothetical protein